MKFNISGKPDKHGNIKIVVDEEGLRAIILGADAIDLVKALAEASSKGFLGQALIMTTLQTIWNGRNDDSQAPTAEDLQKKMKEWN